MKAITWKEEHNAHSGRRGKVKTARRGRETEDPQCRGFEFWSDKKVRYRPKELDGS